MKFKMELLKLEIRLAKVLIQSLEQRVIFGAKLNQLWDNRFQIEVESPFMYNEHIENLGGLY